MTIVAPKIYDENWNPLDDYDPNEGYTESCERPIYHIYVIDQEEISHEEVIREYPETGGKDVEIIIDQEEKGHWVAYDKSTDEIIPDLDNTYVELNGVPHDMVFEDLEFAQMYHPFTQDQINENKKKREEFEAQQQKQAENEQLLDDMPALLCAMYEENLHLKDTVDQQEDALCAVYEELVQVKRTSAIAYSEAIRPY